MSLSPVLYVEDEQDDIFLVRHAFKEAGVCHPLVAVSDGEEALEYLCGAAKYGDRSSYPLPSLLLLDINMPRLSGLEVLKWLRAQRQFRALPALILSSSNQDADICQAYASGANGYLVKPSALQQLMKMAKAIRDFWLLHNQVPVFSQIEQARAAECENSFVAPVLPASSVKLS